MQKPMTRVVLAAALKEEEPSMDIMHRAAVMLEQDEMELHAMRQASDGHRYMLEHLQEEITDLRQNSISHEAMASIADDVCSEYCVAPKSRCANCPLHRIGKAEA